MNEVILGRIDGATLLVRDRDGDDVFDEGERVVLTGPGADRLSVNEALSRLGVSELRPSPTTRLSQIAAYSRCLQESERQLGEGRFLEAGRSLLLARRLADEGHIPVDQTRFSELLWRAVEAAPQHYGLTDHDLVILRADTHTSARLRSGAEVLDYLSCMERLRMQESTTNALDGRRSAELRVSIAARVSRMRFILDSGSRETVAEQRRSDGTVLRVGDRVRWRGTEAVRVITGFMVGADGVTVHSERLPPSGTTYVDADLDYPRSIDDFELAPETHQHEAKSETEVGRLWDRVWEGIRQVIS